MVVSNLQPGKASEAVPSRAEQLSVLPDIINVKSEYNFISSATAALLTATGCHKVP